MLVLFRSHQGENVRYLQEALGIEADGIFGPITEHFVKEFQKKHGLWADGIVGEKTWALLKIATTDEQEHDKGGYHDMTIHKHYMPEGQYVNKKSKKEYLFLHHTAGWHNPYKTINNWANDSRGRIATEFVIGGQSIFNTDFQYDGEVVQAFPEGYYAWHLGKNGNQEMHTNSVGIEVCNFSYIVNGKCYAGYDVHESQIVELQDPFHNKKYWHRYSDKQIANLKLLIEYIANRDNIDVRDGLPKLIKDKGAKAFDWNIDAYYGRTKGLWAHSNSNKYKSDMFPQEELLTMLTEL